MGKFNQPNSVQNEIASNPDLTLNYEGGIAFKMDALTELYTRVANNLMGEAKFYESAQESDSALKVAIRNAAKVDPEFILKLAAYTRNQLYLRSVATALLVEASLIPECKPYVAQYTPSIVKRADELTEAVAYLQSQIGNIGNKSEKGSMPCALKRGLGQSFHSFNAFQFAKYNRDGKVKLKDVVKIVHPKPLNDKESLTFKQILQDSLPTPETWETYISANDSTKESWAYIAPKMPYMATLRNLRNFLQKDVQMDAILAKIANPDEVKHSKQLPFRFLSAYREIEQIGNPNASTVLEALEQAMDASIDNLPKLKGTTFISSDNSGSMTSKLNPKSSITYKDIANTMLAIANRICDKPITSIFATEFAIVNFSKRSTLSNVATVDHYNVGGGTDTHLVIEYLLNNKIKVDRIIIFSDCQSYDSYGYGRSVEASFKEYQRTINPDVYLYSIDLSGYGTTDVDIKNPHVVKIAGWSERILEFINLHEQDGKTAVQHIQQGEIIPKPTTSEED